MTALTLSWCWELPDPATAPATEEAEKPELPVPNQLLVLLFDRLRDFPDAYRAMQDAVRQWRHTRRGSVGSNPLPWPGSTEARPEKTL